MGRVADGPEEHVSSGRASTLDAVRSVLADARLSSRQVREAATRYRPRVEYPRKDLADALGVAAALIQGRIGTRVISVELGGFDTHNDQRDRHDALMKELDASLCAFLDDLCETEAGRRTLVVVFSEFGRRVKENGSRGTDHGTAGPMFLAGEPVRGGLYGRHPSLSELDDGDLVFTTDFRSVYATVIEKWFGVAHAEVLGANYPLLAMLYGFSVSACMSSALSEPGGAGLGTLGFNPEVAERMVRAAGFGQFEIHDFEDPGNLYYEVRP